MQQANHAKTKPIDPSSSSLTEAVQGAWEVDEKGVSRGSVCLRGFAAHLIPQPEVLVL